jgi:EAL domain-containing protein (putative c-di-GMP-specific phosphodiesterase class I)/CheY-like chemotaxis protein
MENLAMYNQSNCVLRIDPVSGSLGLPETTSDEHPAADWRSMPKVLFVDDEWEVVDALRRAFLQCPYRIHTTTSPELALQMFRDEPFDVVVADELMPGMLGSDLLSIIAHEFPATGRILLTGHGTLETAARAVNDAAVVRFLLKPCPAQQLHEAIETALKSRPLIPCARTHKRRIFLVSHSATAPADTDSRKRVAGSGAACQPAAPVVESAVPHEPARIASYANELVLQAQKIVGLQDETPLGYEISVRLQAASGKVHTIGNFVSSVQHDVPLASVDRWVIRHVTESIQGHQQILAHRGLTMSLNVAAGSFRDADFVRFLNAELTTGRLSARFFVEIRESALVKGLNGDEGLLARLSEMSCFTSGPRLCVDGVSGSLWRLAPLKTLPIAMAKIDSRFVCDVLTNRGSEALVRAAVEWGERAGTRIVATGIDSVAIAERLYNLGVRYGQGIALGRPEPLISTLEGLYY